MLLLVNQAPPALVNYTDGSPLRKAGFLSTPALLDARTGQTIFRPCKSVRQCFEDKFTHHGVEATRRVFVPAGATGTDLATGRPSMGYMRDWRPSDAHRCGIFGIWISDNNGQGVNTKCPGGPLPNLCQKHPPKHLRARFTVQHRCWQRQHGLPLPLAMLLLPNQFYPPCPPLCCQPLLRTLPAAAAAVTQSCAASLHAFLV